MLLNIQSVVTHCWFQVLLLLPLGTTLSTTHCCFPLDTTDFYLVLLPKHMSFNSVSHIRVHVLAGAGGMPLISDP